MPRSRERCMSYLKGNNAVKLVRRLLGNVYIAVVYGLAERVNTALSIWVPE